MKPKSNLRNILAVAGCSLLAISSASAADLTWDITPGTVGVGNGTVTGGLGTWNTTNGNWTVDGGVNNIAWNNLNNDTAIFGGTAGAITLGTDITAGGLTFNTNGYSIAAGNTLTLAGASKPIINVSTGTTTINSIIAGSVGLEKSGAGTLSLTGANIYAGGTSITDGQLTVNATSVGSVAAGDLSLSGNGYLFLTSTNMTSSGGISVGTGGGRIRVAKNNNVSFAGDFTGGGNLTFIDAGGSGGVPIFNFNSTSNTFSGGMTLNLSNVSVNSLGDSAANNIVYNIAGSTFALNTGAIVGLEFNNRAIELANVSGTLSNLSTTQSFTINTDLVATGASAKVLTLNAAVGPNNLFGGDITDGTGGGTVAITKSGVGTWVLSGDNSYTGNTTVTVGTLLTTKAAALSGYNVSGKVIINGGTLGVRVGGTGWTTAQVDDLLANATKTSGALGIDTTNGNFAQTSWSALTPTNLGSLALVKLGSNTLTLDQANSYAGATTVSVGAINIQNATALGTTAAGTTVSNGAALEIQGGITIGAEALNLNGSGISNGGALRNISGTNIYGGLITLSGATRINSDDGLLTLDVASGNAITGTQNLTFGGAGNIAVADVIATSTGTLSKDGAGILSLNAANTYTGLTTVNAGELRWDITNALSSGGLTVNDSGTVNIQTFTDTVGTVTIAKGGSITGTSGLLTASGLVSNGGGTISGFSGTGGLSLTTNAGVTYNGGIGSTTLTIDRFTVASATTNHAFNIADGDAAIDTEISQVINNSGANVTKTITKNGAGVLQFSGSTTGTAGSNNIQLVINDGTVLLNKTGTATFVPANSAITIGDNTGSANSAILRYTSAGSSDQITNPAVTINSDGLFDLNGKNETTTGLVSNSGSITTGAGTLTVAGTTATALTMGGTGSINGNVSLTGANGAGITATGNTTIAGILTLGTNTRAIAVTNASDILTISASSSGTGVLTKSGAGTLLLTAASALPQHTTAARVVINGGTLGVRVGGAGWTTTEVNTLLTNATKTSGALGIDTTNGSLTQWTAFTTTNLGSTLGLTKLGTNTLTLDQANTYNGATTVTAGTLLVNNTTGSGTGSGMVIVSSGATLGGSGTIAGATTINGNLNPGNSPGVLSFSDSLALAATTTATFEIDGTTLGTGYDGVNVGTTMALDGNLVLDLGTILTSDATFNLFNVIGATSGDFDSVSLAGDMGTGTFGFTLSNIWTLNKAGNTWTFTESTGVLSFTAIPEPKAALLGAIGVLLLLRRRR